MIARPRHVAFVLDPSYGHILPTLGIAMELIRRGHRVSYAISTGFAPAVSRTGARAMIIEQLDVRSTMCQLSVRPDHSYDISSDNSAMLEYLAAARKQRTDDTLSQLKSLYEDDKPDVIIHDDLFDLAGRTLAMSWRIPRLRHHPAIIDPRDIPRFTDDDLVLVPVPRFFNEGAELFDERFKFIGFMAEGRENFLGPWDFGQSAADTILVSASTGLLPQVEFYERVISAFENQPWRVVLSLGSGLDPAVDIPPERLSHLPKNFVINRSSSNFEILKAARLFIGQGGQGSTLEALYRGVPTLLVSPSPVHDMVASRISQLGLGIHLRLHETFAGDLRQAAAVLMADGATLGRVRDVQAAMLGDDGAKMAASLIERHW